jgi:hypothetical protein
MVFFRNFEGVFEIQNQSAVCNAEVRTNLFEKIPNTNLDSAGQIIFLGEWNWPRLGFLPARRRGLGRNAGRFLNLSFFASEFRILQSKMRHQKRCCP